MSLWKDFIAANEDEIARLRDTIALMEAGTFEMRSYENGTWVNKNVDRIRQDRETIARLEALNARVKAETL